MPQAIDANRKSVASSKQTYGPILSSNHLLALPHEAHSKESGVLLQEVRSLYAARLLGSSVCLQGAGVVLPARGPRDGVPRQGEGLRLLRRSGVLLRRMLLLLGHVLLRLCHVLHGLLLVLRLRHVLHGLRGVLRLLLRELRLRVLGGVLRLHALVEGLGSLPLYLTTCSRASLAVRLRVMPRS